MTAPCIYRHTGYIYDRHPVFTHILHTRTDKRRVRIGNIMWIKGNCKPFPVCHTLTSLWAEKFRMISLWQAEVVAAYIDWATAQAVHMDGKTDFAKINGIQKNTWRWLNIATCPFRYNCIATCPFPYSAHSTTMHGKSGYSWYRAKCTAFNTHNQYRTTVQLVVLKGRETWSFTLEAQAEGVRKQYWGGYVGPKRDEVTVDAGKCLRSSTI